MAFTDLMSAYIQSLGSRGRSGRTTITGMGRDSGSKWRDMMSGLQEKSRQKQQMEGRLRGNVPGAASQFAQQIAPTQLTQQTPSVATAL